MSIRGRIILAALIVVAAVNVVCITYFVGAERGATVVLLSVALMAVLFFVIFLVARGLTGPMRDINRRRTAEEAVRKSEQRFRALVELSSDFYWETDAQHRFTDRQGAVLERMGLAPARDIGKTRWELDFPNMSEADWGAHRAVLERREEFRDLLLERPSPDGRVHWATISGRPLYDDAGKFAGYHGIGREITAQVNAERALRESQARISEAYEILHDALENAPAGIALFDADDKLVAWNNTYKKAFFWFNESLVRPGMDFRTLLREFQASGQVLSPKREGESWFEERVRQHRNPSGDSELELVGGHWYQVRDTRSMTGRIATVYIDITGLKEREAALRRLAGELESKVAERTAELAAANRELEAFAYSVSHDLRAPLRGIDGFSQVLMSEYAAQLDPEAHRMLARVRAAAQRMDSLIADLLRLSQVTRSVLQVAEVDLSALAREIADELMQDAHGRTVEWRIEPGIKVRGDAKLLRIAMTNLLENALKYTRHASPALIEVGVAARSGGRVEIFVRDNGAGFDMAYAARLFQPFQRLHGTAEFEGSGIGLATVERVIAKHGGEVRGTGRPGAGAAFYVVLPSC